MTLPTYGSSAEASKAGWFSRRHRTSDAHRQAQNIREARKKQQAARIAEQMQKILEGKKKT